MKIEIEPIGVIHSPHKTREETPIQPYFSDDIGEVEVFDKFKDGLKDVEGFSHLILVYFFHKSDKTVLQSAPFLDRKPKGVFAMRHPDRPNHIGISVVKLIEINGNILKVKGIDVLDGTPLLDIKPYVPEFDKKENFEIGWLRDKL
ncbi:MAG: tRNA (N6-threonylcarbamoyladenosine(37)-N6)-methyltransferase TrmO [Candidatus Aenigmarchaeota archaeon]|nr:tRNA (N6-threonylcarbamoyladenosine(37)-N6)-methyltransferase TrmO [Candidatus Aenigmarchaeota archaeon]